MDQEIVGPFDTAEQLIESLENSVVYTLDELLAFWLEAKDFELQAKNRRLDMESRLLKILEIKEDETYRTDHGDYRLEIVAKKTRKINTERAERLAAENGLQDQLFRLFRWKAELNSVNWKSASDEVREIFRDAVIEENAKHSFIIKKGA
jgi:hypothetical protein